MDMSKVKVKEVQSANVWYLILGIAAVVGIILLEICSIREFIISSDKGATLIMIILLQLPVLICLQFVTLITDWIHREKFDLYYCELNNGTDIDYIKGNYVIKEINDRGVLFVKKEDVKNYNTWSIFQGYESLHEAEVKLFY